MRIQIREQLQGDLKKASQVMGVREREIVDRALLFYLKSIRDHGNPEKEFQAWDVLSDEALTRMERRLASQT